MNERINLSRRDFLKTLGVAGAGTAMVAAGIPLAASDSSASMSSVRAQNAEVTLLIARTPPRVLDTHEASAELFVPHAYDFYKTQYELLKSRALAAQVIRELRLTPRHLRGEDRGMLEGVKLYSR